VEGVEYGGVRFTAAAVEGSEGYRRPVAVPKARVRHLTLSRGFRADYPFALTAFGAVLFAGGLAALLYLVIIIVSGEPGQPLKTLSVGWVVVPGAAALYEGLQRGYFLTVHEDEGQRRLEFGPQARHDELEAFLRDAEQRFGYLIERLGP
jgi:hypothetical protein